MKKQQKAAKRRPRGRPFKPGESGNPAGRPQGSLNKITLAMLEGIRRAESELAMPIMLDQDLPYGAWDDHYEQFGRIFRKDTLEVRNPDASVLPQLEMIDIRRRRQEILWKGRDYFIQDGWLYDRATWMAVKI